MPVPKRSERIDYQAVRDEFMSLAPQAAKVRDIHEFNELIDKPVDRVLERYWDLLSKETYVEGEVASLLLHISDCLNKLMPPHLNFHAECVPELGGFAFFPGRVQADPSN